MELQCNLVAYGIVGICMIQARDLVFGGVYSGTGVVLSNHKKSYIRVLIPVATIKERLLGHNTDIVGI